MTAFPYRRQVCRRPSRYRPCLEALEDRLTPATHTWTGNTLSTFWSDSGNWIGGSPAGDPQAVLVFPPRSIGFRQNVNDLVGLTVAKIDFQAGNYTLSGNPIRMVPPDLFL